MTHRAKIRPVLHLGAAPDVCRPGNSHRSSSRMLPCLCFQLACERQSPLRKNVSLQNAWHLFLLLQHRRVQKPRCCADFNFLNGLAQPMPLVGSWVHLLCEALELARTTLQADHLCLLSNNHNRPVAVTINTAMMLQGGDEAGSSLGGGVGNSLFGDLAAPVLTGLILEPLNFFGCW